MFAAATGFLLFSVSTAPSMTRANSNHNQSGVASVYSTSSGSRTSTGARLSPGALTAAHRFLPFGTKVRVTNKTNGRSVVVIINDRGPFVRGRVIDLTPAAAHALGFYWIGAGQSASNALTRVCAMKGISTCPNRASRYLSAANGTVSFTHERELNGPAECPNLSGYLAAPEPRRAAWRLSACARAAPNHSMRHFARRWTVQVPFMT